MSYYIKEEHVVSTDAEGVSFRHVTEHGPFATMEKAARFWKAYHGVGVGGELPSFYQNAVLIERDT